MIDLETIEREINALEARGDTTYSQCERLSWLYTVRDHLAPNVSRETPQMIGSEFLELCSGVSYPALMALLDEHMQTLRALYPKSYDSIINRLKEMRRS